MYRILVVLVGLWTAVVQAFITLPNFRAHRAAGLVKWARSHEMTRRESFQLAMGDDGDEDDGEEQEDNKDIEKIELANFRGALIKEEDQPTFEEFKAAAEAKSTSAGGAAGRALEYNWRMGLCKHYIAFEGSDTIRRFKFMGDLLAFGMITGQVALIRMSTGEILDRFKVHDCEVTSIDFDGINLVTGAADGKVAYYSLTYGTGIRGGEASSEADTTTDLDALLGSSENTAEDLDPSTESMGELSGDGGMSPRNAMGSVQEVYDSFHTRSVTSTRLVRIPGGKKGVEKTLLVSTSMDKSLNCVDIATGEVLYSVQLDTAPICMDSFSSVDSGNAYLAVGTIDGKVMIVSPKNGKTLISFQADDRVRSIHFTSENVIVTGGNSGAVKRWNLEGEEGTSRESKTGPRKKKKAASKTDTSSSSSSRRSSTEAAASPPEDSASSSASASPRAAGKGVAPPASAFKNTGRFIDFYFQSLVEGQEEGRSSPSSGSSAGAGTGAGGKTIGKTSQSPTVEKAASAMRSEVKAKDEGQEGDGSVSLSLSSAQAALGSVMNERQRVYATDEQTSPVVSVQADESKILACYEDGNIKAWDVQSMANLFDLQGRTALISCCQFDATRLIADGTHHILVTHDFSDSSDPEGNDQNSTFTYDGSAEDGDDPPTERDE